ncbi:MAG: hypothetical protein U0T78_05045 [Cloacibacterium normanense]
MLKDSLKLMKKPEIKNNITLNFNKDNIAYDGSGVPHAKVERFFSMRVIIQFINISMVRKKTLIN